MITKASFPAVLPLTFLVAGLWQATASVHAAIHHVRPLGDDGASGASWDAARKTVGAALGVAQDGDEVWVAAGVYLERIEITRGVGLYGGFVGSEIERDARNSAVNTTTLDGGQKGTVVRIRGAGPTRVVDGFTIRNGLNTGVECSETSFILRSNVIRANLYGPALGYGGGVSVVNVPTNLTAQIEGNVILENYSMDGGGIACIDASPRIVRNRIQWNLAMQNGGGISCWRNSSPLIAHNILLANTASLALEGMPVPIGGGGIFATADDLDGRPHPTAVSAPVIVNNAIVANGARRGGGIVMADANGGVPVVENNTVVANSGSGLWWGSSALVPIAPVLRNNVIAFNAGGLEQAAGTPTNAVIEYNCIHRNHVHDRPADYQGLPSQAGRRGNLDADPQFLSLAFGDLHLRPGSPCIDAGASPVHPEAAQDLEGQPRPTGAGVDIGADEAVGTVPEPSVAVFHVRREGNDAGDGRTWSTAFQTVQRGIDAAKWNGGEVWVAAGTYPEHLFLPALVYLYGGFAGTESSREARDPSRHASILDGGGVPRVVTFLNAGYRVCRLDGFTVQNGGRYTGGTSLSKYGIGGEGGGIALTAAGPFITGNRIQFNGLAYDTNTPPPGVASYGAGIFCEYGFPVITGNTIADNEILNDFDGSGGGIYCAHSEPSIVQNTLTRNHARLGSAVYCLNSAPQIVGNLIATNAMYSTYPFPLYFGSASGALTLQACPDFRVERNTIRSNTAAVGAGISLGVCLAGRIANNVVADNRAYDPTAFGGTGGGLYGVITTNAVAPLEVVHNTFWGNVGSGMFLESGGAMAFALPAGATQLVIANNLIVSNSSGLYRMPTMLPPDGLPTLDRNNVLNLRSNYINLPAGPTDLAVEPRMVDPLRQDYRLAPDSPCIDAGAAAWTAALDLAGMQRPLDGNADGVAAPDLGAFEFVHPTADTDRDGLRDTAEAVAGTDPTDARSVLRLEIEPVPAGDGFRLVWFGVAGRTYSLERTTDLFPEPAWTLVPPARLGADAPIELTRPRSNGSTDWYRLRVESSP